MPPPRQPFAPPAETAQERSGMQGVVLVWLMGGACCGASIGFTLDLMGWREASLVLGALGAALGAAAGVGAYSLDRRWSLARVPVRDHRGRLRRPARAWVRAAPLLLMLVGLLWMAVVGTVRADTPWMGLAFLLLSGGVAYLFRPLLVRQLLTAAVESATAGQTDQATRQFARVAESVFLSRSARDMARLNLGMLALRQRDGLGAATWFEQVHHPRVRAHACAGLALMRVLDGSWDEAEALLQEAAGLAQGAAVQGELDGVRTLLVLRRFGPEDARDLGERIMGPRSGALLLGIVAVARAQCGDERASLALLSGELRNAIRQTGLDEMVAELDELLVFDVPD